MLNFKKELLETWKLLTENSECVSNVILLNNNEFVRLAIRIFCNNPANIYLFKVNNINSTKRCEICDVNDVFLVFLLLTLNIFYTHFCIIYIVDFEQINVNW